MKTESVFLGRKCFLKMASLVSVMLVSLTLGCGGGGELADPDADLSEEEKAVSNLVGTVADSSGSLERLRELFTRDSQPTPTQQAEYGKYMYNVDGEITMTGDTANFPVSIVSYEENPEPVKQQWSAEKVDGEWKLSQAPLP